MLSSASSLTKKAVNFFSIKITSKKQVKTTSIFGPSKLHRKQYVKKTWILHPPKLCYKKVVKKYMETMLVFDHRNYVKKVRGSNVHFSISEVTAKKHVEITWRFFKIWQYRRNIHIESTSIPRGVPVRVAFPFNIQFIAYSLYYFLNPKLFLVCFLQFVLENVLTISSPFRSLIAYVHGTMFLTFVITKISSYQFGI